MKIFLNPGHGGNDPGAVSKNGLKEKDVVKRICDILAQKLRNAGYSVMVYQEQHSFTEVSKEENKSGADLFVSVHCNSYKDAAARGVQVFYYPGSDKGKRIAETIQKSLVKHTGLFDRGAKSEVFHVLKRTKSPAVLVETAFISNPEEEKLLRDKPEIFAEGILAGIKNYIS
ncbi:cell wall hydrolase/autolysin [Fusobacterium sp. CAG:439]|nr:cell wall hydrolase/autolysin [Fusobacterium sp. CAG:439]